MSTTYVLGAVPCEMQENEHTEALLTIRRQRARTPSYEW
jgi:hypothetical protein